MDTFDESLEFALDGLPSDTFRVFQVSGREAISELFRFEVEMVSDKEHLADNEIVGKSAFLTFEHKGNSRKIFGIVERLDRTGVTPQGDRVFRAILVPRLKKLALTRQNQIYGTDEPVNVRDVLAAELGSGRLKGVAAAKVSGRLGANDFELRMTQTYPKRDYIVQYDESDFAFISRLCEHYGIFYFFAHENNRDAVVFGDAGITFPMVEGAGTIAYRPPSGLANDQEAAVFRFTQSTRMVPAEVCLRDYNYRMPSLSLEVDETVDPDGHGVIVEFGAHFRTPEEGRFLAKVRAQELLCRKRVCDGASDSVLMTAGAVFDLTDHYDAALDAGYLITWIEHEATQALPGIAEFTGPNHQTGYRNRFECQPKSVQFRPARVTPKPKMAGLTNATVDAAGSGQRAEIDKEGRYKIRQQFDQRGETAGQASRYMRKAEPYGGANSGMHFPLLKNTEVVLSCVNGDPDRPIIVGAMQNGMHKSVVNSSNSTANRIQTTSGSIFEIDDGPASSGEGGGSSAGSGAALAPQRALTGTHDPHFAAGTNTPAMSHALIVQRAESYIDSSGSYADSTSSYARLSISAGTESYWRLGSTAQESTSNRVPSIPNYDSTLADGLSNNSVGSGGFLECTDGSKTSWIKRSSFTKVDDDRIDYTANTHRQYADINLSVSGTRNDIVSKALTIETSTSVSSSTSAPGIAGYLNGTAARSDITPDAGPGEFRVNTESDYRLNIGGNYWNEVAGWAMGVYKGFSGSYTLGNTGDFQFGSAINFNMGGVFEATLGMDFELSAMFRMDIFLGATFEMRFGPKFNMLSSGEITLSSMADLRTAMTTVASVGMLADTTAIEARQLTIELKTSTLVLRQGGIEVNLPLNEVTI